MVQSRSQSLGHLKYIVETVFDLGPDSTMMQSFQLDNIDSPLDMIALSDSDIDELTFFDKDKKPNFLTKGYKSLIRIFKAYVEYRDMSADPIGSDKWSTISPDEFNKYRLEQYIYYPSGQMSASGNPVTPTRSGSTSFPSTSSSSSKFSKADLFRRGIKRDPTLFPTLKDEKRNDTWHRSFVIQARAQSVDVVLDSNYVPIANEDIELFAEQQKYVYAVLETTVQTDVGKSIIRKHSATYDAQKVYAELSEHHLKSTQAKMDSSQILSYITSARLGEQSSWKGTTLNFVIHWENQIRLYERQVPTRDHFSSSIKRTMLENAVHPISELRQVKTNADLDTAKTGVSITYEQYMSLLKSACTSYDQQYNQTSTKSKSRRTVYAHDLSAFDDVDYSDYDNEIDTSYDIDIPVSSIEANMTKRLANYTSKGPTTVRLPAEVWRNLSSEGKTTWSRLTDKDKSTITGTKPSRPSKPPYSRSSTTVNLHDLSAYDFLQAYSHELDNPEANDDDASHQNDASDVDDDDRAATTDLLVQAATQQTSLAPGDIRRVMSSTSKRDPSSPKKKVTIKNHELVTYRVSEHSRSKSKGSLIDRGANGGVAGNDVRRIDSNVVRRVDIQGIDNHQITDIPIGTVGGVVPTNKGPVILIMHNYAIYGKGATIHAPGQWEMQGHDVQDKSAKAGGLQHIKLSGTDYVIPLNIVNGLARLSIRPYTDDEFDTLPHAFVTSAEDWDPTCLDFDLEHQDNWYDTLETVSHEPYTNLFDEVGNFRQLVHSTMLRPNSDSDDDASTASTSSMTSTSSSFSAVIDSCVVHSHELATSSADDDDYGAQPTYFFNAHEAESSPDSDPDDYVIDDPATSDAFYSSNPPRTTSTKEPDYNLLRPLFGWLSTDRIKATFRHTTQYGRLTCGTILKRAFRSPNPALNVPRRNEDVATDIVYSDTPAIDNGSVAAVIFVGTSTKVTDIYGIKTDSQFVNTLQDNIRERGAPSRLLSDRAQVEIGQKVQSFLRWLCVGIWQSEPRRQNQNPAERRYQTVKTMTNTVMDRTNAPASTWLLCLTYVVFILNHAFDSTLRNVPLTALTGSTVDISPLLRFHFWQQVYYKVDEPSFPSESRELSGRIVGISEHVGHAMTWKILTDDTQVIIYRSAVRPFSKDDPNYRALPVDGEESEYAPPDILKSRVDRPDPETDLPENDAKAPSDDDPVDGEPSNPPSSSSHGNHPAVFDPEDLVGRTFLLPPDESEQIFRAKIVKLLDDHSARTKTDPARLKFLLSIDDDKREEVITYNRLLEHLERDETNPIVWRFRRIVAHEGPLAKSHDKYMGSSYNLLIEWETGERTSIPLTIAIEDDPVTCAIYAKENGLLDTPGWKRLKKLARRQKRFDRIVKQAKLRSYNTSPVYKYGYEVPRNYQHAIRLDEQNGNHKWADATQLELDQIDEYSVFEDIGHKDKATSPAGFKRIRVHLVFDVKHDGRHKARLVANGNLTQVPLESVYSGVVSLRGFRLLLFLAELNGMETWATDVSCAYLEARTSELVYIIAGPEFGSREGHILLIRKSLYGLRTSGARWHERFADCLRQEGFQACRAEPDIWMRRPPHGKYYEYVACYVDDLAMALDDPETFVENLKSKHNFKFKGTGPIDFHLGMNIQRDENGTLCIEPKKYIDKLLSNYERLFGCSPSTKVTSPIEKGDHPEIDTSELLDEKGITLYQSMVGSLQWVVSIGRFDISTAVMTLSSFRAAPRQGHLDRVKRIYGYLAKMRHAKIRIRTDEPDYSDLPIPSYDWSESVYGTSKEVLPTDAPEPLGKFVTLSHYVDANLMHCLLTGRSVTGILHLLNKTPMEWFAKKQSTVETATYGSEFIAARICVEQIIEFRLVLRYLGVPIREHSYMFGDNESVVNSATTIHSKLHKRHVMLSYHRVRECIASGMIVFTHISGKVNPADLLSKHWGYSQVRTFLRCLLFWHGDTADITDD